MPKFIYYLYLLCSWLGVISAIVANTESVLKYGWKYVSFYFAIIVFGIALTLFGRVIYLAAKELFEDD